MEGVSRADDRSARQGEDRHLRPEQHRSDQYRAVRGAESHKMMPAAEAATERSGTDLSIAVGSVDLRRARPSLSAEHACRQFLSQDVDHSDERKRCQRTEKVSERKRDRKST